MLFGTHGAAERSVDPARCGPVAALGSAAGAVGAKHPRQGRITAAITQVLCEWGEPMQAREVHVAVEALVGESLRWDTAKATLAGNPDGPAPRFVRVARGR